MDNEICRAAVGKRVRYTGTNGNEYDKINHGKPISGIGLCLEYHNSHGLCIIVRDDETHREICVDPISINIINNEA